MSKIFLSYARADRDKVEPLASALEAQGHTVWWDRHVDAGSDFAKDIQRELEEAGAVVVCWSKDAAESRWVRDEANYGAEHGKLVAVSLDGTLPPIGFGQFHAADFSKWKGGADTLQLAELERAVAKRLGTEPTSIQTPQFPRSSKGRWLLITGLIALFAIGGAWWYQSAQDRAPTAEAQSVASIAVLPFEALSDDDSDAYFGRGIAEELLNALSRYSDLRVSGQASAFALEAEGASGNEIGEELSVEHLLRGTVRRSGDRVRITAQLLRAADGTQLWSETYERELSDIFAIQDDIVSELASILQFQLGVGAGKERADRTGVDPRAYAEYLRGLDLWWRRSEGNNRSDAIDAFRASTRLDPQFSDAWASYAMSISFSAPFLFRHGTPEERVSVLDDAYARALKLDPANARALAGRGQERKDIRIALEETERAVQLAPSSAIAHYSHALVLLRAGDHTQATAAFDRALSLDPLNAQMRSVFDRAMTSIGRYAAVRNAMIASTECSNACTLDDLANVSSYLGAVLMTEDENEIRFWSDRLRAIEAQTADIRPDGAAHFSTSAYTDFNVAIAEAWLKGGPWPRELPDLVESGVPWDLAAAALAGTGKIERALSLLEEGDRVDVIFASNPSVSLLDGPYEMPELLRRDSRYHALFERPHLKALAEVRRANGQTAGLPLPIK